MLKPIVVGLAGALLYSTLAVAQTQVQQLNPNLFAQVPRGSSETISPIELQQFAQALKQLKSVEMQTQEKMAEALKDEKLSPQRFQEIGQRRNNPGSPVQTEISPTEQQRFDKALTKIQTIQQEAAPKQNRAITLQGLTIERFNQIGQALERNPALRQQFQNGSF